MAVLIDENTKVICQGLTAPRSAFRSKRAVTERAMTIVKAVKG